MMSENASLYEAKVEWAGVAVAAVWQGKIYIVKDYFNISDRFNVERTLVHELTHILQDRYFQISNRPTQDGSKARAALIEGDACLMEEAYANKTKADDLFLQIATEQFSKEATDKLQFGECWAKVPGSHFTVELFPLRIRAEFH